MRTVARLEQPSMRQLTVSDRGILASIGVFAGNLFRPVFFFAIDNPPFYGSAQAALSFLKAAGKPQRTKESSPLPSERQARIF
jgi:hypothetical protein